MTFFSSRLRKSRQSFQSDTAVLLLSAVTSVIPFVHLKAKHVLILSHCVGTHSAVAITFSRCWATCVNTHRVAIERTEIRLGEAPRCQASKRREAAVPNDASLLMRQFRNYSRNTDAKSDSLGTLAHIFQIMWHDSICCKMLEKHVCYTNLEVVLAGLMKIQIVQICAMRVFAAPMPLITASTASLFDCSRNLRAITRSRRDPFLWSFPSSEPL